LTAFRIVRPTRQELRQSRRQVSPVAAVHWRRSDGGRCRGAPGRRGGRGHRDTNQARPRR
jgi:hypothetical protein